jgi:hypothetical protein
MCDYLNSFFFHCLFIRKARYREQIIYYFSDQMPTMNIEHPRLRREMREALKRHILRERQRKKIEADANKADKQRRRAEKVL